MRDTITFRLPGIACWPPVGAFALPAGGVIRAAGECGIRGMGKQAGVEVHGSTMQELGGCNSCQARWSTYGLRAKFCCCAHTLARGQWSGMWQRAGLTAIGPAGPGSLTAVYDYRVMLKLETPRARARNVGDLNVECKGQSYAPAGRKHWRRCSPTRRSHSDFATLGACSAAAVVSPPLLRSGADLL